MPAWVFHSGPARALVSISVLSANIFLAVQILLPLQSATAQRVETTGTRLGSATTGRTVIRFSGQSQEVQRVLRLLESDQVDEAIAVAEAYIETLSTTVYVGSASVVSERYRAFNAYCAALTRAGEARRALDACGEAVSLMPGQWSAVNNRGTAHFVAGSYDLALADYRRALKLAREEDDVAAVEHNIALAERRLAEVSAAP